MSGIAHTQNIVVASKETTHTENAEDENDESTQINRVTNILPKRNDLSILSHSSSVYTPSSDDKLSNIHEKIKDIVNKDSSSNIKELDR